MIDFLNTLSPYPFRLRLLLLLLLSLNQSAYAGREFKYYQQGGMFSGRHNLYRVTLLRMGM